MAPLQKYPGNLFLRPFAIRFAFTTNHSLLDCETLLSQAQVTPTAWQRWLGATSLTFKLHIRDGILRGFDAKRGPRRNRVICKAYLQRIDGNTTSVVGYCDAPMWTYFCWLLFLIYWIILSFVSTFYTTIIVVVIFFAILFANVLITRRKATQLVEIIETTLGRI